MSHLSSRFAPLDELAARRDEWRALSENALEPNPFYGPDMLTTALRAGASRGETHLLIVEKEGRLAGLFPLQRPFLRDGAMRLGWMLYRDPLTCLTVPLLVTEDAEAVLATALDFLAGTDGPPALVLPILPENNAFMALVRRHARHEGRFTLTMDSWERPAIARGGKLRPKALRAIQKKQRRLEKDGPVSVERMMSGNPDATRLLDAFLDMEARGWKGQQCTAMRYVPAMEQVFRTLAADYRTSPAFLIEALKVGERPVAMNLSLIAGGIVYTVKSTYDHAFAKASPGLQLDAMVTSLVAADDGAFLAADSCASPGHPLLHLWPDRLAIVCLGIALRPSGRLNLAAMTLGKSLSNQLRRWRYHESYTTRKIRRFG